MEAKTLNYILVSVVIGVIASLTATWIQKEFLTKSCSCGDNH